MWRSQTTQRKKSGSDVHIGPIFFCARSFVRCASAVADRETEDGAHFFHARMRRGTLCPMRWRLRCIVTQAEDLTALTKNEDCVDLPYPAPNQNRMIRAHPTRSTPNGCSLPDASYHCTMRRLSCVRFLFGIRGPALRTYNYNTKREL